MVFGLLLLGNRIMNFVRFWYNSKATSWSSSVEGDIALRLCLLFQL